MKRIRNIIHCTADLCGRSWRVAMTLLAGVLISAGAQAWDSTPGENGLYDGLYDRPTHFPEWSQPATWPNAMYYLCDVRLGDADGPQVPSYEIAVYDQNRELRHCGRSIPKDNNLSVLTIRGEEGDVFHFKVIYGDDFQNPIIVDVPDVTVPFKTNNQVGTPTNPFLLILPGRTYLRETDTTAPAAKTDVDVTVMRTIKGGEWGTICLPFAISADKMDAAFGEGWKLGDFTGCDVTYTDETEETVQSINVKFENATAIEANHPYIIKVVDDVTEINVNGVDIIALDEDEVAAVDCDPYPYQVQVGRNKYETHYWYNSFIGNYINGTMIPEQCLFLGGGKFWYSTGKTPLMAFRAYFDFYDVLPEASEAGVRMMITFEDDEATGIKTIGQLDNSSDNGQIVQWYDLQGRRIGHASSSTLHAPLKSGCYIMNGRKYIIK